MVRFLNAIDTPAGGAFDGFQNPSVPSVPVPERLAMPMAFSFWSSASEWKE